MNQASVGYFLLSNRDLVKYKLVLASFLILHSFTHLKSILLHSLEPPFHRNLEDLFNLNRVRMWVISSIFLIYQHVSST